MPKQPNKFKMSTKARRFRTKRYQSSRQNYKKLILIGGISLVFLIILYFWGLFAISNIANFWQMFKGDAEGEIIPIHDKIPPPPPYLYPLPEATNSANINIYGLAEAGSTVFLFTNGGEHPESVIADKEGNFVFEKVNLKETETKFYVKAHDDANNESQPSNTAKIIFDKKTPELTVFEPQDGQEIKSKTASTKITGQTEQDATVIINSHQAIVDWEGKFSYLLALDEGINNFKIVAKDKAGNETIVEKTVRYIKTEKER